MHFDPVGQLTNFTAVRYRAVDGTSSLQAWSTPVLAYGELAGLRLPVRGGATWNLATGDLDYIDVAITALEFDGPVPCPWPVSDPPVGRRVWVVPPVVVLR